MNEIDNVFSDFIVAIYIASTSLVMINVFIALLTSTFEYIRGSSKANFLLEKAIDLMAYEKSFSDKKKDENLDKIKNGSSRPYFNFKSDYLPSLADNLLAINKKIQILDDKISKINSLNK